MYARRSFIYILAALQLFSPTVYQYIYIVMYLSQCIPLSLSLIRVYSYLVQYQ